MEDGVVVEALEEAGGESMEEDFTPNEWAAMLAETEGNNIESQHQKMATKTNISCKWAAQPQVCIRVSRECRISKRMSILSLIRENRQLVTDESVEFEE